MAAYKIYHKDGSVLKDSNGKEIAVHSIEYNGTWMGECFVTVTFENEAPIDFSIGDYIVYRNERFEINYDPGKIKCSSKDSYGGAFKYDNVKFNALSDELVRCDMLDLVLYDNNLHYTALPQFSFYVESLDDLLDRIQANLDELYGKAAWKLYSRNKERSIQRGCTAEGWESAYGTGTADNVIDSTSISISDQNCWDALSLVNSQFDVNFIIRDRNVYVGTAGVPTANIFKYGKDKGLYEIEQNSESDQMIITRLRAYGSNRNLPNRYYADLGSIPFLNITGDYHDGSTENGLSVLMEDSVYAGMFTDIVYNNGSNIKHCRIRGRIDGYEFDGKLELVKKDAVKSSTRLLVEEKASSDAVKAKIDSGVVQVDFLSGANKAKFDGNRLNYVSNLPNNMACDRLMLPGFPNKTLKEWWDMQSEAKKAWLNPSGKNHIFSGEKYRPFVDSLNTGKIGVRPSSVFFDKDDKVNGIVEIYPTIEGMEVEGVRVDEIYKGSNITDDGRFGDNVKNIPNFAIYLNPKINFDISGLMQEDFTICMKDGMCAGREFKVAGCVKQEDNSWKLTVERALDNSLNLYFPYKDFQIKVGDHFVLTGIELPDAYVEAASEKLLKYCIAYLDKNDYTRYVYQPKVDKIFMARQHDTATADASGLTRSLYLTLKEGDIMLFKDEDLGIDAEITIDQLTIKEEDGKIPTYEVTLREEKEVGTIQKIQNQISSIVSGNGGAGTAGGGLTTTQIKNLIDSVGSDRFLSKLNPDTAAGIITFLQGTNWGNFTSETGAAMTVDPNTGQTYMEVDRLKVRLKAFFEQLEVQKVGYVGGKLIVTNGQGVDILDVENIYDSDGNISAYRCYFLGEQEGRKIDNLLRVKDQMICKDFNVSEGSTDGATNKYYWRLATAVSSDVVKRGNDVCHWVDLSATDCDTNSDIPEIGDTICHLGNREDTDRQGAEILSVVDANSPSFTIYSGIDSYSLVDKEYIDMGIAGGKAYCNIYGSTYIGDRERQRGYLRWNDDTKTFDIKGTIDITSPLSSGGTIGGAITDAANAYKGEFDAFTNNVTDIIGGFQAQIDGVIETWFYEPEPTLGNEPAVNWTDNTTKDKHLGDLYYSGEGLAYRFQKEGDNYVWKKIDDTAITKALAEAKAANDAANAAQGTADSKMRVFVVQPTDKDEYSVGDLWVNATYPADGTQYKNDILRCKTAKKKGEAFSINHWEKASKYTDDTAANAAKEAADKANASITTLGNTVSGIYNLTDEAFRDRVIDKTERDSLQKVLADLEQDWADVASSYSKLTENSLYNSIADDIKADFKSAYDKLKATYESFKTAVNNVINSEQVTDSLINGLYNNYENFKTDYAAYVSKMTVVTKQIDAILNKSVSDLVTELGGYSYLKKATAENNTLIEGGLILSTLIGLGYTDTNKLFHVMSGMSGIYESNKTGNGIAFWAGGSMVDAQYDESENPAQFLVRHDGTGYAAGGNLWWEKNGKVHADPLSFIINEDNLGNLLGLFKPIYSGGSEYKNITGIEPLFQFTKLRVTGGNITNGELIGGLQIGDTKFYVKDGVLFLEGDLAVTGGITMYATDGVASSLMEQILVDGTTIGKKADGTLYVINTGNVRSIIMGTTTYTPNDSGAVTLPEKVTWANIEGKPSTFAPSEHTHSYLPLSGGTMTGALNFKNGTWNSMGADAYIGDCNVAGMIGVKGANAATPGFVLYDNSGTLLGKLYASGGTLNWSGGTIAATTFSGNASSATKSEYSRSLLGRRKLGGDYDASSGNLIFAEWNTMSDNRWYLKADGYECRVAYATNAYSATKMDSSAGSATLPIYFSDGKPVACTASSVFSDLSNSGNNISVTVAGQNRTLTVGYADTVDGYHASNVYNAPTFILNNPNTSNTYVLLATITISGTSLACAEFTTLFQNRECLDSSSFILSGAIRRNSTTSVGASLSYITLHTGAPRNIYMRSDDGVTFRVYIQSLANSWTTYYRAIPIVDSGNITYSNTGTTSPISGSVLNIAATKGGNVNYANSAGSADTASKWATARTLTLTGSVTGSVSIDGSGNVTLATTTNHTHPYLPLAGGTMEGTAWIVWPDSGNWGNSNSGVTFPVTRGGLRWNGQSDWVELYAQETGGDNLDLVLQFGDDNSNGLSIRNNGGSQTAFISATGHITATNGTVNGTLKVGAIPVTNSSSGVLKIDGNLIVTGGITMYATDGVVSGLMEQILVDGTTIGKKADGTLYAINTGNVRSIVMGSTTYTPNSSGAVTLPEKVTWANIEGKPSTFTPSAHIHAISDITNLQTTLDGKAATSHTHSYLPLSGGTMTGNITYKALGTSYIGNGAHDAANGVGGELNNLVISSWNGISFTTSCSGQTYTNTNAVSIDCRKGYVYANTFVGALSGNAATASKLGTATVGSGTQHFYLNAGTATASTSTVGGTAKPMYLKAGVMTAISDTLGGTAKPIFLNAGTLTAISATVGSASKPVYLNGGTITACSYDFTSYLPLSGGTMTGTITSTVNSETFLDANKGKAIINSTAAAGFNMLARMKSTNGVFIHGAYNDSYRFYYTGDSMISAGTNNAGSLLLSLGEDGYVKSNNLVPLSNNTYAFGLNGNRWIGGYFSNALYIGAANSSVTSGTASCSQVSAGYMDLSHSNPYIDFHYDKGTGDYTSRIIAIDSETLNVKPRLVVNGWGMASDSDDTRFFVNGAARVDGTTRIRGTLLVNPLGEWGTNFSVANDGKVYLKETFIDQPTNGTIRINGNLIVTGGIAMYSDTSTFASALFLPKSGGAMTGTITTNKVTDSDTAVILPSENGKGTIGSSDLYYSQLYVQTINTRGVNVTSSVSCNALTCSDSAKAGTLYVGTSNSSTLKLNSSDLWITSVGSIRMKSYTYFDAGYSSSSDERLKDIKGEMTLTAMEIANAPLVEFTYKVDRERRHAGTIAQYWEKAHKGIFTSVNANGYLALEMDNLGVAMGISLAREIVKYESKTDKKIRLMRKRINELEARVKELEERRTA